MLGLGHSQLAIRGASTERCRFASKATDLLRRCEMSRNVTSDKTHIEHNTSAIALIDMRVDVDFRRSGPTPGSAPPTAFSIGDSATSPFQRYEKRALSRRRRAMDAFRYIRTASVERDNAIYDGV
jgi:hypothetical protein